MYIHIYTPPPHQSSGMNINLMWELELQHTAACGGGSVLVCCIRSQLLQTALEEQGATQAFMSYVSICSRFILVGATQFGGHI